MVTLRHGALFCMTASVYVVIWDWCVSAVMSTRPPSAHGIVSIIQKDTPTSIDRCICSSYFSKQLEGVRAIS